MSAAFITDNIDLLATAPSGIQKLRGLILELAVRGKLVPQDPNDEPASELLKRIEKERARLEAEGVLKQAKPVPPVGVGERPFSLPSGWAWQRLDVTGQYINGLAFKPSDWGRSGRPIIRIQNLSGRNNDFNYTEKDVPNEYLVVRGDILVSWSATLDAFIWDRDVTGVLNQHIFRVVPSDEISRSYLYWLLRTVIREMAESEKAHGLVMKHINRGPFLSHVIAIPPLAEQHRIVAKVEELMALCDRLEAEQTDAVAAHAKLVETLLGTLTQSTDATDLATNWQRLAEHFDTLFTTEPSLDALKQTILQLAVMGKLVPQDPNDEPASATLAKGHTGHACDQSHDADVAPFAIPPRWRWEKLQQLLEPERDISYGVIKLGIEPKTGGVWTLRCSDVKPGMINLFGVRKVSDEIERNYIRTRLTGGEILLNIRGTLGGVALVPSELAGYNVAREVAVIPVHKGISGKYLVDVMLSDYFWKSILNGLRGIAYKGLNLGTLRTFLIPLPPLTEQHRIVAKVDELMALCDRLKADLIESRSRQERLAVTLIESALEAA